MSLYCWTPLVDRLRLHPGDDELARLEAAPALWTAGIRSSLCRWPSPKLNPINELQTNSPSRTVRVSMSGRCFSSSENRPRPWLCMLRQAIVFCRVISAHFGS